MNTLIYLHGFNSSSQSTKANIARDWLTQHAPEWFEPNGQMQAPDLPHSPEGAITTIQSLVDNAKAAAGDSGQIAFMGSSMGGFLANHFAEQIGSRAVMINPVIYPHRLLHDYLGPQENLYTGERYELTADMLGPLRNLVVRNMNIPENRRVLLQTGDEILDYREAVKFFGEVQCEIIQGGDHGFVGLEEHMPAIREFLLPR